MISKEEMVGNFMLLLEQTQQDEWHDGMKAYSSYHQVLLRWSGRYGFGLRETAAAFVALSPNNDYLGNLRSLSSLMDGANQGRDVNDIVVSTFGAAKKRAHRFLTGGADLFLAETKGLKTRAFFDNIVSPRTSQLVTVDGHMSAASENRKATMREAAVKGTAHYARISDAVVTIANVLSLKPHQVQAVVWLTRKRVFRVKWSSQFDLFRGKNGIDITPDDARAYNTRSK